MALAVALSASPVLAQNTSSALGGQVTGTEGKPVAGATVTIKHIESGTVTTAVTDASGRYTSRGLRVGGPYTITITKDGVTETRENVYLQLAETKYLDASLGGPKVLDTVKVTGVAMGSEVFSADKMGSGTNISREQIDSFASINRNLQDFARLDPRVAQTDKARNEISVGGQNPRYNAVRVDGISISDTFGLESNSLPTPRQPISLDIIQEIKVDVANYDVTVTGGTGGVITAVTKSGTNEFHGSLYGTFRDNDWSGENQNGDRPSLFDTESTFGLTLGGPIVQDKLFFFVNYEKYKGKELFTGNAGYGPVGSGATNIVNITQAQIDEIIDIAQNTWGFNPGDLTLPSLDTETEEYGVKIDWNINDQHRADFRYSKSEQSTPFLQGFGRSSLALNSYHYVRDFNLESYTLQLFSDWTDSFSTEAKVSYRDYAAVRNPLADLPQIQVVVGNNNVFLGTEENTHANVLETQTWNGFLAGTFYKGDHTLKFGVDYENNDIYNLFGRRTNGVYSFASIADFQNGTPSFYQYFRPAGDNLDNMAAIWGLGNIGLFAQDTWAVNGNLTFNYGFRYDTAQVDKAPTYNAAASAAFGVRNDNTIDGKSLFQPRIGFNYTFDSERPTQLRGGMGLFRGAAASVWLSNPYSNNGIAYADYRFSTGTGVTFVPDPDDQMSAFAPNTPGRQSVDFIDPNLNQPSVWKANLAVEHELPWFGLVASAEFVRTSVEEGIFYQQLNLGASTKVGPDGRLMYYNTQGLDPNCWTSSGANPANAAAFANNCASYNSSSDTYSSRVRNRTNSNGSYNDAIIAKSTSLGGSDSFTLSLQKPFNGSDWTYGLAFTYTDANEVSPLTSSTSSSQLGNVAVFQANEEVNATSNYEIKNRVTGNLTWKHAFFGDYKTLFTVFYEGRSGRPYSYTFDNDANGDGRLNDLLYIPASQTDVVFGTPAEAAAFWAFVQGNSYLSSHLGQVAQRNAVRNGFVNSFDVKISQEIPGFMDGHKGEIWLDIMNIGNLINKDWGRVNEYGFPGMRGVVEYGGICSAVAGPCTANDIGKYVYRFNTPDQSAIYDDKGISRWALQVGFRYSF